jgi:hypothetical protein
METSHLPLKIRARYGNLVHTMDHRAPQDADNAFFEFPLRHIRTLLPQRLVKAKSVKKPAAGK